MADTYADDAATKGLTPDEKIIARAKACFKQGTTASEKQRQREQKALAYYADDQWDKGARAARDGREAADGMPKLPPRPTITINKVKDPCRQIINQEQDAELGIEIVVADDFEELSPALDDPEIQLREGLVRRIQRESDAAAARSWAFKRSTISGSGVYRILTRYLPGKTFDQEVYIARIYEQASVVWDPSHVEPDGSDAEWVIVGTDMPWTRYTAEFPGAEDDPNRLLAYSDEDFRQLTETEPDWFETDDKGLRVCRVVEYFTTERVSVTLCELPDGTVVEEDDVPDGVTVPAESKRVEITKQIKWFKLDGMQILDRTDWPGPDMPFVKVLCDEVVPYDDERRAQGVVEPAMGAQEGFNAVASKFIETYALAPQPTLQATPEQVEDFKPWYQARATRNLPYLPYKPVVIGGQVLPEPHMLDSQIGPTIQALTMGLQMFSEAVSTTTGIDSQLAHLGHSDPALKSGKAIQALQAQSMQGTSGPLNNFKRSVSYEGHILNNLLYPIYGKKPGRLVRIVNGQGEGERLQIAGTASPDAPQSFPGTAPGPQQPVYRLTPDAKFNVIIKISPKVTSRRAQEAATLGEIINSNPQMMGVFGDLFFKYQDGPGHQEMSERAKAMLVPPVQQLIASKSGGAPDPAQLMQQVQQLQQQLQQIEGIAHGAAQELQSKQLEQQTKIQIAQMENETKIALAAADRETKLAVAELGAKVDRENLFLEERNRVGLQLSGQEHDDAQNAVQRQHEKDLAAQKMQHDEAQKDKDRSLAMATKKTKTFQRGTDGRVSGLTEESVVPSDPSSAPAPESVQ